MLQACIVHSSSVINPVPLLSALHYIMTLGIYGDEPLQEAVGLPQGTAPVEVFTKIRGLKDNF